jgi:Holliday junction resolvase RusA-like endonuclease
MKYILTGKVVPKARPRFGGSRAYLPPRYRDWKENAIAELLSQTRPPEPIAKAEVSIDLFGSHRGDLDNIAGAVLDSLVQSGILLDDSIGVVSKLTVSHHPNKVSICSVLILQLDNLS